MLEDSFSRLKSRKRRREMRKRDKEMNKEREEEKFKCNDIWIQGMDE